jgi:cellulose/xylan binding protein with CBM9 domain
MNVIHAYRTSSPPQQAGNLDQWSGADYVMFEGRPLGGHPRSAKVYTLWDDENLYIAFDVHSSKLQARETTHHENLALDDGVEFLIDAHCDRTGEFLPDDFSYHVNILNVVYDDRGTDSGVADPEWHGIARHVVTIVDDYHYVVEMAVPWPEIGLEPRADETVIGIDLCVNGTDPKTGNYDYFDWCGLKIFHVPSGYGELRLLDARPAKR